MPTVNYAVIQGTRSIRLKVIFPHVCIGNFEDYHDAVDFANGQRKDHDGWIYWINRESIDADGDVTAIERNIYMAE